MGINIHIILLFCLVAFSSVRMVRCENRHYDKKKTHQKKPTQNQPQQNFDATCHWVDSSVGQPVPPNSVRAGEDVDGNDIYVGLAKYDKEEMPAKVIPKAKKATVPYFSKEVHVTKYKVLVEKKLEWVNNTGRRIPPNAVSAGRTFSGEKYYIARRIMSEFADHSVGKVDPRTGIASFVYAGSEEKHEDYDLLVYQ